MLSLDVGAVLDRRCLGRRVLRSGGRSVEGFWHVVWNVYDVLESIFQNVRAFDETNSGSTFDVADSLC